MSTYPGLRWDRWPDPRDRHLLTAVLHPDLDRAADAWRTIRPGLDLADPTSEQYRLFPLLGARLAVIAPDDRDLGMLQGVARRCAIQNLNHLRSVDATLATLEAHGGDPVVLKGPALACSVYPHVGQRPFVDVDVWVDPAQHRALIDALEGDRWWRESDHRGNHAVDMGGEALVVDLHRALNRELVTPGVGDTGWQVLERVGARRPLPSGRTMTVLAPTESLLFALVHGTQWDGPVHLRWVADAAHLVWAGGVDGDRLVDLVVWFGVTAVTHDALVALRDLTGITELDETIVDLARVPFRWPDRVRTEVFRRAPAQGGWSRSVPEVVWRHAQARRDAPLTRVAIETPGAVLEAWGVDGWAGLPGYAARFAGARVRDRSWRRPVGG